MSRYIRLRGLPWSVTHQEIIDFLSGCNVVNGTKGIHLVTNRWDGKNTGEAFVELENEQDEEQAFKHNKETLGHRYIEIFSASNEEAEHAIRKPGSPSIVVKLRGLPYAITEEMIEEFFNGLEIKPDREGILIVMDRRGRATGEAYVQFETQDDTEQALKRNREKIGHRYIEIFRSSVAEMRRQSSGSRPGPYDKKDRGGSRGGGRNDFGGRGGRGNSRGNDIWANNSFSGNGGSNFGGGGGGGGGGSMSGGSGFNNGGSGRFNGGGGGFGNGGGNGGSGGGGGFGDFNNFGNNRGSSFDGNNPFDGPFNSNRNSGGGGGGGGGGGNGNFGNNNFFGGGSGGGLSDTRNSSGGGGFGPIGGGRNENDTFCVHMRGLPYYCFENDVNRFFEPVRPVNVKIIYNNKGLHSGSADAYFDTYEEAMQAMKKHREQMGNRYIELFFDGKQKGNNSRRI